MAFQTMGAQKAFFASQRDATIPGAGPKPWTGGTKPVGGMPMFKFNALHQIRNQYQGPQEHALVTQTTKF